MYGTRVVVLAHNESTVLITNPAAPELVGVATVIEVTAKGLPKPEAAFVVNCAPRKTTLSERMSTPVTATLLEPELIVVTPAKVTLPAVPAAFIDCTKEGEPAK